MNADLLAEARYNAAMALTHLRMCAQMTPGPVREACHRLAQQYVATARALLFRSTPMPVKMAA